ncbi:hypothetical protein Taro_048997 [Colocasia esculenta]|uniref:Uncharacterized protein n=1 Tax=Colocasia esculenta TaxID=4460 RepID=A0A843X9N4_COLES|nr:hypothetical protein [Colocasia esculenta]
MACNFWRWSKIWKAPFCRQKASSGSVWALLPLEYKEHGRSVSTPQATTAEQASRITVSTHRQTVSTPLATASEQASGTVN